VRCSSHRSHSTSRLALSVLAIALGVALGYAVQLVNRAAIAEFSAAVQTLSGEADLVVRGSRAGFDESLYPRLAKLPQVAVASPVLELDARLPGRREPLKVLGLDIFRAPRSSRFWPEPSWAVARSRAWISCGRTGPSSPPRRPNGSAWRRVTPFRSRRVCG
jgi:hypothetical protein